ncbi:GNAT family N-acetyltransferase [Promicromonospora kroppenstedtii]|uniref:GNAT family N-acetyltransferase n=1 Tax=Promicromonospora kroppenstedtii TaxID=440482 RepID=UPI000686DCC6|nr:GNAT family N-acetyltransferase [Promicromonospora kroppenstedtii]
MTDPDPNTLAPQHTAAGTSSATPVPDDDQKALMGEVAGDDDQSLELTITKDETAGIYDATVADQEVGGLTYRDHDGRVVLVAVSILPQFRHQGAATQLIRHVLDDLRAQGKKATVLCPIVRTFIDKHTEYQDVVDPQHPGVVKVSPR